MSSSKVWEDQQRRNRDLIEKSRYMREKVVSEVLPFSLDLSKDQLTENEKNSIKALEIESARTSIRTLASLATIGELDHLGGGLDLIPALTLSMLLTDYEKSEYTIENAHASIGYYALLAALGYLDTGDVVEGFRRGLDIGGHVSWLPGGTQLSGGRLGVMIPVAVGQALGLRARHGDDAQVFCHCGDAGWISGQALNGFNGADLHQAPITFIMQRNGIQLSDSNKNVMDKDPRPIIEAMGIEIIETPSLFDLDGTWKAYRDAKALAKQGRPSMIYPVGFSSSNGNKVTLKTLTEIFPVEKELEALASANSVALDTEVWIPGSLMSYRDATPMLECVFLVNDLPGGKDHHDGHMKGREEAEVLSHPMMTMNDDEKKAYESLCGSAPKKVTTEARPVAGTANLVISESAKDEVALPDVGAKKSPRVGSEAGYDLVAKNFPDDVFVVSCDLDPSTKLGKARSHLKADHQFEMSIEEQAAALMCNGLAMSHRGPQLNVVSTFAAFYEGIAREAMEMWRYQRNLTGANEGLNVDFHISHVGACTGRDHFAGWSLDWITMSMGYLPYLDRFYAPCDARSAFIAVTDCAARYGAHIVAIPRDNLPVLGKQDGSGPLFSNTSEWEAKTDWISHDGAKKAILAFGAPAYLAGEASEALKAEGTAVDVIVVNGLPFGDGDLKAIFEKYPEGVVTIEDGIIATREIGLRGFASLISSAANGVPTEHVGIVDPRIAPSEGHIEVWDHFGLTKAAIIEAVKSLGK